MNEDVEPVAEVEDKPNYEFNFDSMPVNNKLLSLHQEGNYVVGVTEAGVRFKQHIPVDKMLSKNEKGDWCFIPLRSS